MSIWQRGALHKTEPAILFQCYKGSLTDFVKQHVAYMPGPVTGCHKMLTCLRVGSHMGNKGPKHPQHTGKLFHPDPPGFAVLTGHANCRQCTNPAITADKLAQQTWYVMMMILIPMIMMKMMMKLAQQTWYTDMSMQELSKK